MRRTLSFILTAQTLFLIGCAAPASNEPWEKYSLAPPPKTVASKELQQATCPRLKNAISAYADRIKALEAKAKSEQAAPPPDVWSALQRTFGGEGAGIAAREELAKERAAAEAANLALASKGCPTVDIDRLIRSGK